MIKNKKQMYIVIGVFALVMLSLTVTYAFFNYTRTGTANTIRTGRIAFNSQQGTAINLTNMFPIDVSEGIPNDNTKVGSVTINVTGDTTYTDGIEYLVSAVNVQNTIGSGNNQKTVPISIDVRVSSNTNNDPATNLGTSSNDYFNNRGGDTSYYSVVAGSTINTNDELLMGYITPGSTGVDGNIVIRAYLDASRIAITDTYDGTGTGTNGTTTEWVDERTVFTTEEWNSLQSSGISFKVKVEANEGIWVKQIPTISLSPASGGVASGSSTTSTISTTGDGTMTCSSSNQSIATCSVSGSTLTINGVAVGNATITVNQAEGTNYTAGSTAYLATVEAPAYPTISSCEGCKFIYTENEYFYSANNYNTSPISTLTTFENNNETLVDDYTTLNKNYFLGFKFDETTHEITHAYACGIKGTDYLNNVEQNPGENAGTAFCIEGSNDGSTYSATNTFLNDSTTGIWQGRCDDDGSHVYCNGSVGAHAYSYGGLDVGGDDGYCYVTTGLARCYSW